MPLVLVYLFSFSFHSKYFLFPLWFLLWPLVKLCYIISKYLGNSLLSFYYCWYTIIVFITHNTTLDFNPLNVLRLVYDLRIWSMLVKYFLCTWKIIQTHTMIHWKEYRPAWQETKLQSHLNHNSLNDLRLLTNSMSLLPYLIYKYNKTWWSLWSFPPSLIPWQPAYCKDLLHYTWITTIAFKLVLQYLCMLWSHFTDKATEWGLRES